MPSSSSSSSARPTAGRRVVRLVRRGATGGAVMLRPKEVRAQLAVSASTLRVWSNEFKNYLSPAARTSPALGRTHRRYTAADVQVLERISQLLQRGHRCEEVKHLLPPPGSLGEHTGAPGRALDAERDRSRLVEVLTEREGRLRRAEEALGRLRRLADTLAEQADGYKQLLEAERAAHAETRRTLLQVQRELAAAQRAEERLREAVAGLHAQVDLLTSEVDAPVWKRVFR
jgi:DNA-binding transcriptional MerR regulator